MSIDPHCPRRKPDRLVILACSRRKRPDAGLMPAIDRYDGPLWQTLRTIDRPGRIAQAAFLSARFGLRDARWTELPDYDTHMTDTIADAMIHGGITTRWPRPSSPRRPDTVGLHPACEFASMAHAAGGAFSDIALVGGCRYIRVLECWITAFRLSGWISPDARICMVNAPIGLMRQQLRAWLKDGLSCSST